MKVHFNAPLNGKKSDYQRIVTKINDLGYELVTNHVLERDITQVESETEEESELQSKKLASWIKNADIVVFDTSAPEVSLGYEIALALNMSKPVIVLYRKELSTPHGLKGIKSDKLQLVSYNDTTLEEMLEYALDYAEEATDIRFNFFVTPTISAYLDWIARERKLPRSVYLRRLIENDMGDNQQYAE